MVSPINRMENRKPRWAMASLTNPETGEGAEVLNVEMLAASQTREEPAALLLENLHSAMVATAPKARRASRSSPRTRHAPAHALNRVQRN
jgi:hypothetical protein